MALSVEQWTVGGLLSAGILYLVKVFFPAAVKKLEEKQKEKEEAITNIINDHKEELKERDKSFKEFTSHHERRMDFIMNSHKALTDQVIRESEKNREIAAMALKALNENNSELRIVAEMNKKLKPLAENAEELLRELKSKNAS